MTEKRGTLVSVSDFFSKDKFQEKKKDTESRRKKGLFSQERRGEALRGGRGGKGKSKP